MIKGVNFGLAFFDGLLLQFASDTICQAQNLHTLGISSFLIHCYLGLSWSFALTVILFIGWSSSNYGTEAIGWTLARCETGSRTNMDL